MMMAKDIQRLFSERLQLALDVRDPTYQQLLTCFGTTRFNDSLSRYTSGDAMPQLDRLVALCVMLRVRADWLLGLDVESPEAYDSDPPETPELWRGIWTTNT